MKSTLVLSLSIAACAGHSASGALHAFEAELQTTASVQARTLAPDLWARADQARREAEEAVQRNDRGAESDCLTKARLFLAVAITESQRLRVEAARLQASREETEAETLAARAREERTSIERDLEHDAARATAEAEIRRALDPATARPRRALDPSLVLEATRARTERARLLAAAAEAMGADAARLRDVRAKLSASCPAPLECAARASAALNAALALLGETRARRDGPTGDEVAALFAALSEIGLTPERTDSGTSMQLPRALSERGVARGSHRVLERLAAILTAHPHGPIQLATAPSALRGTAVLEPVRDLLSAHGVEVSRIVLMGDALLASRVLRVTLPEYAAGAANNAPAGP